MDKKNKRITLLKSFRRKAKAAVLFFGKAIAGIFFCYAGIYSMIKLAESDSDFLYYAMAFASPGTAVEILNRPFGEEQKETDEDLTGDAETEENESKENTVSEFFFEEDLKIIPEVPENCRGTVTEIQYSSSEGGLFVAYGNAMIKNCTKHSSEKIKSMLKKEHCISLSKEQEEKPQVLIYHTHATEGYEPCDRGYFDTEGTWRSTNAEENMTEVGAALTKALTEKGIGVVHDGTMHDDPSYNGSYGRSAVTVKKHLAENEGIKVCLDIHRDAIEPSETEIIKPTAVINGKKAAQIMIIAGCDDGTMNMPDYWENLRFAAALADKLEELYPGICRPILFDYRKYNMDLSPGLLLIEIGATGNTLEEAKYSAELLGNALAELLCE